MSDINSDNSHKMLEEVNERTRCNVAGIISLFTSIRWKHVSIIIPLTPKPSQRPRLTGFRVYVPGAAKNASFFDKEVLPHLQNLFITTPCKVSLDIYMETPVSFSKTQKCLSEMKILRPWASLGDIDNFEKAVYDMIQPNEKRGHTGILSNDSLIIESHANKYYSVTPRYELKISYLGKIPESIKNVMKLK